MFIYSDHLPIPSASTLIVPIPATVKTKQDLLETLATGLNFPAYFGWNWDALDECLRDLSWLPFPQHIVLFHEAIPFAADSNERSIYLDLLENVVADWGPDQSHVLRVVFPTTFERGPEFDSAGY